MWKREVFTNEKGFKIFCNWSYNINSVNGDSNRGDNNKNNRCSL